MDPVSSDSNQQTPLAPPISPQHKVNLWMVIAAVLLLILIGVGGYYLGTSKTSKESAPAAVQPEPLIKEVPTITNPPSSEVPSSSGSSQAVVSTKDWKPFESLEMKFSLLLPDGWYAIKPYKGAGSAGTYETCFSVSRSRSSCTEGMTKDDPVGIDIGYYDVDTKVSLNDEAVSRINAPYSGLNKQTELTVLNGHEAVLLTSKDGRSKILLSRNVEKGYMFTISTIDAESAARYFPVFDRILSTFKFN